MVMVLNDAAEGGVDGVPFVKSGVDLLGGD